MAKRDNLEEKYYNEFMRGVPAHLANDEAFIEEQKALAAYEAKRQRQRQAVASDWRLAYDGEFED